MFTVDVTSPVVAQAADVGAELIIAHHPVLLRGISSVTDDHPKGRVVRELLGHDISVYVAHTNADVAEGGVASALADALGLPAATRCGRTGSSSTRSSPLCRAIMPMPCWMRWQRQGQERWASTIAAPLSARAWERSRPLAGSTPFLGAAGVTETVTERRIEMVMPRRARSEVVRALLRAHPYQTPAYDVIELAESSNPEVGLGRIEGAEELSVGEVADRLAAVLPATAAGIRIGGDLDRVARTVAVLPGSGDDLLETAHAMGADAYVTSDLRHHRASEALAWADAPALIDISHWAAEWIWLPVVERLVRTQLETTASRSTPKSRVRAPIRGWTGADQRVACRWEVRTPPRRVGNPVREATDDVVGHERLAHSGGRQIGTPRRPAGVAHRFR